jgi:hypothetical protein
MGRRPLLGRCTWFWGGADEFLCPWLCSKENLQSVLRIESRKVAHEAYTRLSLDSWGYTSLSPAVVMRKDVRSEWRPIGALNVPVVVRLIRRFERFASRYALRSRK